jgi:FkbM family methyltransferase
MSFSLKRYLKAILMYGKSLDHQLDSFNALRRISNRGMNLNTLIDVGASDGRWSREYLKIFKGSFSHMIEAQKEHSSALESFCSTNSNSSYVVSAAGDELGEIWFDDGELFGGLASKTQSDLAKRRVPMTTVDHEVSRLNLKPPYALKLDTHGFELPILKGSADTLNKTNLVIIETYNFHLTKDSLLFYEMCAHMDRLGFRTIDISEPRWRQRDNSFWQMDLFFVRKDIAEFKSNDYT